jgi:hypothetical protein
MYSGNAKMWGECQKQVFRTPTAYDVLLALEVRNPLEFPSQLATRSPHQNNASEADDAYALKHPRALLSSYCTQDSLACRADNSNVCTRKTTVCKTSESWFRIQIKFVGNPLALGRELFSVPLLHQILVSSLHHCKQNAPII